MSMDEFLKENPAFAEATEQRLHEVWCALVRTTDERFQPIPEEILLANGVSEKTIRLARGPK